MQFCLLLLLLSLRICLAGDVPFRTVGPSGSDCASVQAAINAVPEDNDSEKLILIEPGSYFGHTVLNRPHVRLRGAGVGATLVFNLGQAIPGGDMKPIGWQGAAALLITADDARIENLTIENTYGKGMQAQACSVVAERVAFFQCRFLGWQDTLKIDSGPLFFEQCYISGHVDFIYGSATAYFSECEIYCRDSGYIVAPSTLKGRTGFVFQDCKITFPFGDVAAYLGRPWRESPSATFVGCEMSVGVRPEGWHEWNVTPSQVRFAEYGCKGSGSEFAKRVGWAKATADAAPNEFSRAKVLGEWKP